MAVESELVTLHVAELVIKNWVETLNADLIQEHAIRHVSVLNLTKAFILSLDRTKCNSINVFYIKKLLKLIEKLKILPSAQRDVEIELVVFICKYTEVERLLKVRNKSG